LQHDADERRGSGTSRCAEFLRHRIAPRRVELGQRLAGQPRQMIERGTDGFGIAAKRFEDIGLDRRIISAGHGIFRTRRDDHGGDGAQVVALG
jgi:hypothetical protein